MLSGGIDSTAALVSLLLTSGERCSHAGAGL